MSDYVYHRCEAWPNDAPGEKEKEEEEEEEEELCPVQLKVIFQLVQSELLENEYDDPDYDQSLEDPNEAQKTFYKSFEELGNDESISEMLQEMYVPIQPHMIKEIKSCAEKIAVQRDVKVVAMCVEIECIVDQLPGIQERNLMDLEERMVPASRVSIEGLEIEEGSVIDCPICLQVVGSEGRRMPCSHVYHRSCIGDWLNKSHYCPLCRYQMPVD